MLIGFAYWVQQAMFETKKDGFALLKQGKESFEIFYCISLNLANIPNGIFA